MTLHNVTYRSFKISRSSEPLLTFSRCSVHYRDALISHGTGSQQWLAESMSDNMQHWHRFRIIEQQGLTGPIQQQSHSLELLSHCDTHNASVMTERKIFIVMREHPWFWVVAQPCVIAGPLAFYAGIAYTHFEGGTRAHVKYPALSTRGHGRGAEGVRPAVEARRVIGG